MNPGEEKGVLSVWMLFCVNNFADSRTEVQRYRHIDNGYHSHLLISGIFKDNGRTTVSCGGAHGVFFFNIKSDTHYKNPLSHGRKKERARERETREGRGRLPLPSRVSLSRARCFLRPPLF